MILSMLTRDTDDARNRSVRPLNAGSHCLILTALLALLAALPLSGATGSDLADIRENLELWVKTQKQISQAKSEWQAQKEVLKQTIQAFGREIQSVEEKMTSLNTNSVQIDKERAEAQASLDKSNECLERARKFAAEFEGQLTSLVPRLPEPLQDILKPWLDKLPSDPGKTDMRVTERVTAIVKILNEVDKFNNAVTIFTGKRKNQQGEEVAVQTVYVGLGAAYFVNDAGDFAGMGSPGPKGWEWTDKPELAYPVKEVIRIYRNERTAKFVSLPATIR
jgi:Protein of unknown function (DUF3450)